jgi:hypothetical protein
MTTGSVDICMENIRSAWGPLTSDMAAGCRKNLHALLKTPADEPWLAALHRNAPASQELYRDPADGFVLLAHTEYTGLYRPPHDHGRGWVIYAVQQGEIEMDSYARVEEPDGTVRLVKRDATIVRAGETKLYLPGDIHDTLCVNGPALLFRFTERDLKVEDREHRLTRYANQDGVWTASAT